MPNSNIVTNTLRGAIALAALFAVVRNAAAASYTPPASARISYDFNPAWQFIKKDASGAEAEKFNDRSWTTVSTPHTWNDVDSYDEYIYRGGERTLYMGPAWYRKHFKLPAEAAGSRVIVEFEGMRQAAKFWLNGKPVGKYEDGVTACGIDITDAVRFGDEENVLAVWITNVTDYKEEATGVGFQWSSKDFNPNFGGINRNVRLHILPKIHQTLPLLNGLGTTGVYVYASDFNVAGQTATIHVESQVRNISGDQAAVEFSAIVVDASGNVVAKMQGEPLDMVDGETGIATASGPLANARWWSPEQPTLYDVYSILSVDGKVIDVNKVTTGFRKTEFKGGAGTGGVFINDKFTWLTGWAQRSTNEWAAIGAAYPDWMHDYDMRLMRSSNGNYVRWMHIAPKRQLSDACDRVGIVQVCPAGDKERNPDNPVQWNQRVEVMRRTIVYFRNSPSILFWEAGNNGIPANRMQQMVNIRKELDPSGGRVMGCRSLPASAGEMINNPADNDPGAAAANTDANLNVAEYFGVMLAQDPRVDKLETPTKLFRAFSFERRDKAPFIETEAFREESLRTYWDNYSPPNFGFKKGKNDTYDLNSEQFALAQIKSYNSYWAHRITLNDDRKARWSAYASIVWADSLQLGRNPDTETARTSGKVDAVRIPKQVFYAARVMQSVDKPDIHILGHWTYPAGTKKTMYVVAANVAGVELFLNGKSLGKVTQPADGFVYAFPDVVFAPGAIKAVGYDERGAVLTQHELKTAGPAAAIRLTPHIGPQGFLANGGDIAFFDVEVVDAEGNRCPTDQARVDFELSGPAIWRGGVNEFKPGTINHTYLDTECGINRVFIRSTFTAGEITLTAKRNGLAGATINIDAKPVKIDLVSTKSETTSSPTSTVAPWVPDQGDGTYRNPILYADYSDPDAIRIGDDYWLTASSFNHVPGLPILHSKDLVNWTIVNHALPVNPPREYYSMTRHSLGVYAPSIRYHDGKYWIYYGDPDFGIYLVTATDPRGKWSEPVLVQEGKGYIDTCPIWDDDGKAYLVCGWAGSRGRRANLLTLHEMTPDGTKLIGQSKTIIDGRDIGWKILEGPKFYKRDGYYWIFAPAGGVATGFQGVFRSKNIWGPYEHRNVLDQGATPINGPHQGAWLDTPNGENWFLHFQKAGPYGRITHLQPMRWRDDGWPVMGNDPDNDGKGEPVLTHKKPALPVQPITVPATSDEFETAALGLQWQWQANPRSDWWTLTAAPGSLRLNCIPREKTETHHNAPSLLMQKFSAPSFTATTILRFFPKADGDTAGLMMFGRNYAWLGLRWQDGKTQLQLVSFREKGDGKESVTETITPKSNTVYLRVSLAATERYRFEWSEDGVRFSPIGGEFAASHVGWVGAKFGIFASAAFDATETGHAEFDWFRVTGLSAKQ